MDKNEYLKSEVFHLNLNITGVFWPWKMEFPFSALQKIILPVAVKTASHR